MGGPGRPYCLGQVCEGHLLRSWSWGTAPAPTHTASDPRGLYRWTGTQPSASTQVANRVHAPGTGLVTLDRLIQPSATQERSVLGHEPWDSQGSRRLTIWWQMDRPQ